MFRSIAVKLSRKQIIAPAPLGIDALSSMTPLLIGALI